MLFIKEEGGLRHTYSDTFMIRQIQTGNIYDGAYDILDSPFTYEETDIPLEQEDAPLESEEELPHEEN